ncbi:phage major capsid protein [Pelagibacterium sp. 26DY04]|uniref:phage major capsid protein n=1 Tax=Pelagibacterium sp. 26DY04 TaxID=2967130 RepID=UPI002814E1EC|nr:phage major capsid protein [Pelagibacterium sp. 26DY04]WMT88061.1 phage major capsid protein [Pelagibacterium sp. 26DY04]
MTKTIEPRLENKAAAMPAGGDVNALFAEFMSAFEEFKSTNDRRLGELEKRGSADTLLEGKLDRLNAILDGHKSALDRVAVEKARPALEGGRRVEGDEYKDAFSAYVKRGEEKALSVGSNPDGGYLVPAETETEIAKLLTAVSPMRAICGVRQVSSSVYKKPITVTGPQVGWVGETAARSQTSSQVIDELTFPTTELYAMPAATQAFLDDAAVDVGQWIAEEVNAAFAEQETTAFITGDGVNKPSGFLNAQAVDESDWAWEKLGYVATGTDAGFDVGDPSDSLIDLVYALKAGYRQNATWLMNRRTQGAVRKLKDADGNYLWQPAASPEGRASLMGFSLVEAEDMPDIDTDSLSIAFGDFRRGYLIVDRQGVNILRDPYSAKPYVLFYTTKRVGGGIADYDAIKLLKFGVA